MSFANTGIYTAPSGATNQVPGNVIRSATWNTIFTDLSAALTQLAQQSFTSIVGTVTASPYTVQVQDSALIFNLGTPCTVVMPTPSTNPGRWLRVKTVTAQSVVSSTTNIQSLGGGAAQATILAATIGKFASMTADGTNWVVMSAN